MCLHGLVASVPKCQRSGSGFDSGVPGPASATDIQEVKVHHWYQQHRRQICYGVSYTCGIFATGKSDTGGKFATGSAGAVENGGK